MAIILSADESQLTAFCEFPRLTTNHGEVVRIKIEVLLKEYVRVFFWGELKRSD